MRQHGDPKKNTQARLAMLFGVSQQCVSVWLMPNTKSSNRHKPKPDARVKLSAEAKAEVVKRAKSGESQTQIADGLCLMAKTPIRINRSARLACTVATAHKQRGDAMQLSELPQSVGERILAGDVSTKAARPAPDDGMNQTEREYAAHLELRRRAGEIVAYRYESIRLRLADKCWYLPDFEVVNPDGSIELHEVKGFWRDDARVKWKAAADKYREFRFVAVTRDGGRWRFEAYKTLSPVRATRIGERRAPGRGFEEEVRR